MTDQHPSSDSVDRRSFLRRVARGALAGVVVGVPALATLAGGSGTAQADPPHCHCCSSTTIWRKVCDVHRCCQRAYCSIDGYYCNRYCCCTE